MSAKDIQTRSRSTDHTEISFPIMFFVMIWMLLSLTGRAVARNSQARKVLRIAYSADSFHDVDLTDARMAMDVWANELGRSLNIPLDSKSHIYQSLQEIETAVRNKEVDFLVLPSLDYLALSKKVDLEPVLIGKRANSITDQYILLVHQNAPFHSIPQLAGKTINMHFSHPDNSIPYLWLQKLLSEEGLPKIDIFFQSISKAANASKAVIPVFFRRIDACVVNIHAFNVMRELNPQLERELKVIATSPPFLRDVTCFRRDCDEDMKQQIQYIAEHLHETERGNQLLLLFKLDAIVPYSDEHLESVKQLQRTVK